MPCPNGSRCAIVQVSHPKCLRQLMLWVVQCPDATAVVPSYGANILGSTQPIRAPSLGQSMES